MTNNEPIPKETARQVLLMVKGIEGIDIEADDRFYYATGREISIEHVLKRMGYDENIEKEVI